MELKKAPKADMNRHRSVFFNFGLALSLAVVLVAFEWKTLKEADQSMVVMGEEDLIELEQPPVTVQPPPPKPVIPQVIIEQPDEVVIEKQPEVVFTIEPDNFDPDDIVIPEETIPEEKPEKIFLMSEVQPVPKGGLKGFYQFLGKKIKYPSMARRAGVEGKVIVSFVVDKDGSLTDIQVLRGIGYGCDEEALRVLKMVPNWSPGRQRGEPVKVRMAVPITFSFNR